MTPVEEMERETQMILDGIARRILDEAQNDLDSAGNRVEGTTKDIRGVRSTA